MVYDCFQVDWVGLWMELIVDILLSESFERENVVYCLYVGSNLFLLYIISIIRILPLKCNI